VADQFCARCGFLWEVIASRKNQEVCQSCRARKQQKVGTCLPWHGGFSFDFVTPVDDDGLEVMPGLRTCGNADCVNSEHVRPTN
jgi:hypothetical protein